MTLTSGIVLKNYCVQSISFIFFEVGIPNLMCGCILGWWSVMYHLQVTVTLNLTFASFLEKYIWSISLVLFEVGIQNLAYECILA